MGVRKSPSLSIRTRREVQFEIEGGAKKSLRFWVVSASNVKWTNRELIGKKTQMLQALRSLWLKLPFTLTTIEEVFSICASLRGSSVWRIRSRF